MSSRAFCGCYLLRSLDPRHPATTYIGFTVNPLRRIRQHNGEIKGGANKTKGRRPWTFAALVHGFPSQHEALQFEWAWQHPAKSKVLRAAAERAGQKSATRQSGWKNKLKLLELLLTDERWQHLSVRIPDPEATPVPPALHESVTIGSVESWLPACLAAENKSPPVVQEEDDTAKCCAICGEEDEKCYATCDKCGANLHARCLRDLFDQANIGPCPLCDETIELREEELTIETPKKMPAKRRRSRSPSSEEEEEEAIDLTTPRDDDGEESVISSPMQTHLTPVAAGTRPDVPLSIVESTKSDEESNATGEEDDDSIIDLTRSVTRSHISSPCPSLRSSSDNESEAHERHFHGDS